MHYLTGIVPSGARETYTNMTVETSEDESSETILKNRISEDSLLIFI